MRPYAGGPEGTRCSGQVWVLAGALVLGVAVFAYPPPQTRIAGDEDRSPSKPVQTQQGPITGVYNDERTVEVFEGIPYAQAPVGVCVGVRRSR
ncbi:carboxylesterase family protein [Micromonospora taraxaci]|uniref:carboxylesterase family protein n=1 Tax=Micromonospora taraxaci TaxID=1316803 RepID=UPI0033C9EF77